MEINDPSKHARATSRRGFTKTMAGALIAVPLIASSGNAQTAPEGKEPAAPPKPQSSPSPSPQKPSPVADAYAEVARARFGDKLSKEDLDRLRRNFDGNLRAAEALRSVVLKNGQEPDFIFRA